MERRRKSSQRRASPNHDRDQHRKHLCVSSTTWRFSFGLRLKPRASHGACVFIAMSIAAFLCRLIAPPLKHHSLPTSQPWPPK